MGDTIGWKLQQGFDKYQKTHGPESVFLLPLDYIEFMAGIMQRGLLLDRDGVVNVEFGYVGKRENFVFKLGLFPFLREMQDRNYRIAIVTNQSGVSRALYTEEEYYDLTKYMLDCFRQEGIAIDSVLACFEFDGATIAKYKRESFWRKPNPGMILEAAQKLRLDLSRSIMIGDRQRDMEAAQAAGVGTRLWMTEEKDLPVLPDVKVIADFDQALAAIE